LTIALPARAKLNLDLAVLGRRDDGFHEVRTTLQAIDLHDLITLTPASKTSLTISGLLLKNAQDNSILKAHAALEQGANKDLPTQIHLYKRIPPGAGMGGASSDAATTLSGLSALHHIKTDLMPIARLLGADVPFFLTGGTAIAEQRGDHLTPIATEPAWFAIAWPGVELLTSDVYRAWDQMQPSIADSLNHLTGAAMRIEPRLKAFANSLNSEAGRAQEKGAPANSRRSLGVRGVNGALSKWQMTGSGSAFFLRCGNEEEARAATAKLTCWTAVAQSVGAWA
jgi:4-diphosphocytidyl-2-C-methyl-D-erythritol kinase